MKILEVGNIQTLSKQLKTAYQSEKIWKLEWFGIGAILLFMLCSFTYSDCRSLTIWSTNIWDVLFEGRFQEFYAYSALNLHNVPHQFMGNDLVAVLPWSVWNLPIWAVQYFLHIELLNSPLMMLWSKLFLVAAFALMMRYTYRIALLLMEKEDKVKALLAVFLSASSLYFFTGIGFAGQNDIIFLLPAVMGIYSLLKEKSRPWLFYAASAYSIAVKPFFLFAYIAILLLSDKRILRVCLRLVYGLSGLVLCRVLFAKFPFYKESLASGPTETVMKNLFGMGIASSLGTASLLVLGLAVIYIWSYIRRPASHLERCQSVIYATGASFMLIILTSQFEFYRPIILLPFIPLLIVTSRTKRNLCLLLDTIMAYAMVPALWMRSSYIYTPSALGRNVVSLPAVDKAQRNIASPVELFRDIPYLQPAFAGVVVACGAALLLLLYPGDLIRMKADVERCQRGIFWARLAAPIVFTGVSFVCYLWVK